MSLFLNFMSGESEGPLIVEDTRNELVSLYIRLNFKKIQTKQDPPEDFTVVRADSMNERIYQRVFHSNHIQVHEEDPNDARSAQRNFEINKVETPIISRLKMAMMTIQATSTASERTFSISGTILTKNRSTMRPALLDKLVFLKYYFSRAKKSKE